MLTELGDTSLSKWTFKRVVDSCIFITPRRIYLQDPSGKNYLEAKEHKERPLRAETMQGDRIALARSEMLPEGSKLKLTITLLESSNAKSKFSALKEEVLKEALNYGAMKGLGQWRSAGYGAFTWKEVK